MQRLLIIRGGAVGDIILTLPALRALRQAFPHATLEVMGNSDRMVLAQHPCYTEYHTDLEQWDLYRLFSPNASVSKRLSTYLRSSMPLLPISLRVTRRLPGASDNSAWGMPASGHRSLLMASMSRSICYSRLCISCPNRTIPNRVCISTPRRLRLRKHSGILPGYQLPVC
jgi:hypothetical protein